MDQVHVAVEPYAIGASDDVDFGGHGWCLLMG